MQIKYDRDFITLVMQSISENNKRESCLEYKTRDGFTGYKINCPICQTNKGLLNTRIFPKEMKNGRLQWFYNCNGRASCKCNGINTFQYFYTNYLGF